MSRLFAAQYHGLEFRLIQVLVACIRLVEVLDLNVSKLTCKEKIKTTRRTVVANIHGIPSSAPSYVLKTVLVLA